MLENYFNDIDFTDFVNSISDLLQEEIQINEKIINNIPLTQKEYFFKKYTIPPSLIIKHLYKQKEDNNKEV